MKKLEYFLVKVCLSMVSNKPGYVFGYVVVPLECMEGDKFVCMVDLIPSCLLAFS